uniref:AbgT family transporter n=1 Tax=Staphylococcus warneri TaxID=1292 RepID=UPI0016434C62
NAWVKDPGKGESIDMKTIMSDAGFGMIMNDGIKKFCELGGVGVVVGVMIGIGGGEKSGYLDKVMI